MTTTRTNHVPTPTPSWTRLRAAARFLYALLGANVAIAAAAFAAGIDQRAFYARLQSQPWTVTVAQLHHQEATVATVNAISITAMVATAIAFAAWAWLAYSQVEASGYEQRFRRGWAAGSWFVPIVNLYRPKQIIDDIVDAGRATGDVTPVSRWTAAWWSAWVLTIVGGWFISVMAHSATTVDDAMGAAAAYLVRDVLLAVTAVLAIVSVHRITRQQLLTDIEPEPASSLLLTTPGGSHWGSPRS